MDHSNDQGKVMRPHLDILPEPQRHLWSRLSAVPDEFVLYGGTAIALHLGHRQSLDFDFFSFSHFCADELFKRVPFLADARVIQQAPNTLSVLVPSRADGNDVKVSFFGLPRLRALKAPHRMADNGLRVAHLLDLAGMKMAALPRRVSQGSSCNHEPNGHLFGTGLGRGPMHIWQTIQPL